MRVLLSVYDKTGLEEFARELVLLGHELIASGGTASALAAAGIAHSTVESVTEAPEMLGGRVKTIHPRLHGGILADLSKLEHRADLEGQGIAPIGLVVCNLYPFRSSPSIELIDVGGPTMVRAAAKNWAHVGSVVDPADYPAVLEDLRSDGRLSDALRRRLAASAFAHTAAYDAADPRTGSPRGPTRTSQRPSTFRSKRHRHFATGRTLTSAAPDTERRASTAGGTTSHSTAARSCPISTSTTPTRPGASPTS